LMDGLRIDIVLIIVQCPFVLFGSLQVRTLVIEIGSGIIIL
jgi:hypothetical protein